VISVDRGIWMLNRIWRSLRYLKGPRPPELFQVELTAHCNSHCSMCARSSGLTRAIGHMDLGLFKEIVDQSKHHHMPIGWLHHFGETLMYPKLREALSYFRARGLGNGAVSTNAILLDKEHIDVLLENAKVILCCIDTLDPEAYQKIRCNDKFDTVRSNIQQLIAERNRRGVDCKIAIQLLRTKFNRDEDIGEMADYFGRHPNLQFFEKLVVRHPGTADVTVSKRANILANKTKCRAMSVQLCVLWTGECVPCCWDANGEQVIGDFIKQRLIDIWQGARHKELQQLLGQGAFSRLPLCEKCAGPSGDGEDRVNEHA
jgi:sulfatase maturation enzyme AslB (radical SAM superfamily)